jgi:hypothetical protein
MQPNNIDKIAEFLINKFSKIENKDNFKRINDLQSKLVYYNFFFDSYQEMFQDKFNFIEDINIFLDIETNVFMVSVDDLKNKKIIFDTPHYTIINSNFPLNDWKLLKLR